MSEPKELLWNAWRRIRIQIKRLPRHLSQQFLLALFVATLIAVVLLLLFESLPTFWSPGWMKGFSIVSWIVAVAAASATVLGLITRKHAQRRRRLDAVMIVGAILGLTKVLLPSAPRVSARDIQQMKDAIASTDRRSLNVSQKDIDTAKGVVLSQTDPEMLAEGTLALQRFPEAIDLFDRAMTDPERKLADAHFYKARALWALGHFDGAAKEAKLSLTFRPMFSPALVIECSSLRNLRLLKEALSSCNNAVDADKKNAGAWNDRANVLIGLGDHEGRAGGHRYEDALSDLEIGIKTRPDAPQLWNDKADALHKLKRNVEALVAVNEALRLAPDFATALLNKGTILKQLNRLPEAVEIYRALTEKNPSDPEAWNNLGDAFETEGSLQKALDAYDVALRIKPDYSDALFSKGEVLNKVGRYSDAIPFLEHDAAVAPTDIDGQYQLALSLDKTGHRKKALAAIAQILRIDPHDEAALKLRKEIEKR